jgi:tetratricopeptide (TPR) repeat protein
MALQSALRVYRESDAHRFAAWVLQDIADARNVAGDIAGARPLYAEALQLYRITGADEQAVSVARNLAEAEFRAGALSAALTHAYEALSADRMENHPRNLANDLVNVGAYLIADGKLDDAAACTTEALALARSAEIEIFLVIALQHVAAIEALRANEKPQNLREACTRSARLAGYVDGRLAALGASRQYTEQQEYDKILVHLHRAFGHGDTAKFMEEGARLTQDQALIEAGQGFR